MEFNFFIDWYMVMFYLAGTVFGLYIGRKMSDERVELAIENTIDMLINNNFVKWKRNKDGDIELIKLDEKDF